MDIITKVWRGDAGLARTYWLFGLIGSFVWGLLLGGVKPGSLLAIVGVVLFLIYVVIVNVGTWRAASRYEGPKGWAVLAKIVVAALPALLVVGTLAAIVIPSLHSQNQTGAASVPIQGNSSIESKSNHFDAYDSTNQEVPQIDSHRIAVSKLRSAINSGEITVIGTKMPINLPLESRWPDQYAQILESSQTWWIEDGYVFIHLNNTIGRPLEAVDFLYKVGPCPVDGQDLGEPYNFTLQNPVIGSVIVKFPAGEIIKPTHGCLTIIGAVGGSN